MNESNYIVESYDQLFFNELKIIYEDVFKRKFLEKEAYNKRFRFNGKYSSYLLIEKNTKKIKGHIGFKIYNFNEKYGGLIAFRYSTFILDEIRGKGIYQSFFNEIKKIIRNEFKLKYIFAWPNTANLISCLKDKDYINLNPILTWQHKLGTTNYRSISKADYEIFNFVSFNDLPFLNICKARNLTNQSLEELNNIFFNRDNKRYIVLKHFQFFSIIGISIFQEIKYLSIVINEGLDIEFIISTLNDNFNTGEVIIQLWCDPKEKKLLREIMKANFKPDGPIFYNGVYELTSQKFPVNSLYPKMFNHDAF